MVQPLEASNLAIGVLILQENKNYPLGGLTTHQAAILTSHPCPQLFAVVSWGCAATAWISTILNRHPDIYCVHAANHFWHVLADCDRLDGVPYMRLIGAQGHSHVAAGEVHGVSRHLIPELRRSFAGAFNAAVVVREPMPRLHSQLAHFEEFAETRAWDVSYVDEVMARTGVTLPAHNYRNRFFVHAVNMLNAVLEESDAGKIYRSEDLTQNADVLGDFIEEITRGKVSPDSAWLASAVQTRRVNEHTRQRPRPPFEDWQVDVIRRVVDPRSWEIYETLGYSVAGMSRGLSALSAQAGASGPGPALWDPDGKIDVRSLGHADVNQRSPA